MSPFCACGGCDKAMDIKLKFHLINQLFSLSHRQENKTKMIDTLEKKSWTTARRYPFYQRSRWDYVRDKKCLGQQPPRRPPPIYPHFKRPDFTGHPQVLFPPFGCPVFAACFFFFGFLSVLFSTSSPTRLPDVRHSIFTFIGPFFRSECSMLYLIELEIVYCDISA